MSLLAVVAALAVTSPAAQATKYFDSFFGGTGTTGGLFGSGNGGIGDIAVNDPGVDDGNGGAFDGWVYVVDRGNSRIQAFDENLEFQWAIGRNASISQIAGDDSAAPGFAYEKCVSASDCQGGTSSAAVGGFAGERGGMFNVATGIDIDQETGHFFVGERATSTSGAGAGNRRVQQFDADGEFVRAFGWDVVASGPGNGPGDTFETCNAAASDVCQAAQAAGPAPGQFNNNTEPRVNGIAVAPPEAPNAGTVYAVDPGTTSTRRVLPFTIPADPTDFVAPGNPIGRSNGSSEIIQASADDEFAFTFPRDLAVGSDGVVYASNRANQFGIVNRYDPVTGSFLARIGTDVLGRPLPLGMEVDRSTGNLLVGRASAAGIMALDVSGKPPTIDSTNVVDAHGAGLFGTSATDTPHWGLGVDPVAGHIYVSTQTTAAITGAGHRVVMLDDSGVEPQPTVDVEPADDIGTTTATLRARIDPNRTAAEGFPTSYRFQVSKDGINWTDVTDNALLGGDGFTAEQVSASVTGLDPNTLYRFRVRTQRDPAGGVSTSAPQLFQTNASAPSAESIAAQQVSDTAATLVGRLNPGGLSTSYWFEWGDTGYGNTVPVPAATASGSTDRVVAETISGLTPGSVYHFRLCAQNPLSAGTVCGADRSFATRAGVAGPPGRSYEMVTPPDKALRRGGTPGTDSSYWANLQTALPSPSGDTVNWALFAGVTDAEAGHAISLDYANEIRHRVPGAGWRGQAVNNHVTSTGPSAPIQLPVAFSADLNTLAWSNNAPPLPLEFGNVLTRVIGDTGGPLGSGWYPWISSAWVVGAGAGAYQLNDGALVDDTGERMLRWANGSQGANYRDLVPADDDVSPSGLVPPQTDGLAVFRSGPENGWRPDDLINECTGAGAAGDETQLLTRVGGPSPGTATDTIGVRDCGVGSPTSHRGAGGIRATAMSEDGDRVFFVSPDPATVAAPTAGGTVIGDGAGIVGQNACAAQELVFFPVFTSIPKVGADTECPAQLFVRQYDDSGNPTVRWISRAEDALFDAPQRIGQVGRGAVFEGASRDGDVAYFRTNAPLTSDDPNGGNDPVSSSASDGSWDLYRYELGDDNNADPAADDPGDRLTRVSGGPAVPDGNPAATDPSTNVATGDGTAVRFMSDDGNRVYFVTAARLGAAGAAWNAPRPGDVTVPGGAVANGSVRNLYLYDATRSGAAAYRFVAQLPFSTSGADLNSCASANGTPRASSHIHVTVLDTGLNMPTDASCVRGTTSGDAVLFETTARLTADDSDEAGDVYLYDAMADDLTRLSAPPVDSEPYPCLWPRETDLPSAHCNATLGTTSFSNTWVDSNGRVGTAGLRNYNLSENADGRLKAVYFESLLPLTPADRNDGMDVYEWRGGRLSLVSPGAPGERAFYSGNSRNGSDVFMWTEQRISAWEIDEGDGDIYNATTRDPLPGPPPPPAFCAVLAAGCHGAGAAPLPIQPRTTSPSGDGNVVSSKRTTLSLANLSVAQRRKAARSGILPLRVRSNRAGVVRLLARAGMGRVARASKRVRKAGVATVKLRLNRGARAKLRSGKKLRLTVEARQSGARTRTRSILLPGVKS